MKVCSFILPNMGVDPESGFFILVALVFALGSDLEGGSAGSWHGSQPPD